MEVTYYKAPLPFVYLELIARNHVLAEINFVEQIVDDTPVNSDSFLPIINWLDHYFSGENLPIDFPIAMEGTDFQLDVWQALQEIPYGQTTTYGALAKKVGAKRNTAKLSAQAIGHAVGKNPLPILIPCHRVVGTNKNLVGYTGGLDKKISLLTIEQHDLKEFKHPDEKK
ncbi:methylated-DNA--[protein]-cysteine S-methyltransferase [Enterococcus timonensis]|uniref:methylated-DNA--[protein]-cysteine S-methyltransferase n=1 Tax=Enterococcus timonensis TaxID=1852364 RepID=UPI0008DAF5EE|nr:methylated-DNA--[protein]-cysteine S-methyltransferase [Enterococcus timonensis]